jgi:hypothetical protein
VTAEENIRAQFAALLEQGSLPLSACSGSFLKTIRSLVDSGVVIEERAGGGRRLAVHDTVVLRAFFSKRYPDAGVFEGASSRIAGVARFRDTKALELDEATLVCVRAWQTGVLLCDGRPVEAAAATAEHGVFAFLLGERSRYSLRGACALVENPAVFTCIERLNLPLSLAIYGHGRASTRLVDWLAGITTPDFALFHLPDYDPVGLSEFARFRARLGKRVRLHLPADLPARFERFSNRSLLDKANNRTLLANLHRSPVPEIRKVLELIDRHNAGLEQEALLLELNPS